jgi:putative restriction endonuclease
VLDETRIRLEAIQHVRTLRERWAAVPASELRGITVLGERVLLRGQQGIFKPAALSDPLSITTTISSDYTHDTIEGSCVMYDFVPQTREHENEALKRCAENALPLIYFLQLKKRPSPEYAVFAPVYVVGWDDERRRFLVDLSEQRPGEVASPARTTRQLALPEIRSPDSPSEIRELTRRYVVSTVQRRLYEARFRNAVLDAYHDHCAVCELHVRALLDAAHVTGDRDPKPEIDVSHGIALCATHHRAFDNEMLTFDGDYNVRITVADPVLLAYDGKHLALPADERHWPQVRGAK